MNATTRGLLRRPRDPGVPVRPPGRRILGSRSYRPDILATWSRVPPVRRSAPTEPLPPRLAVGTLGPLLSDPKTHGNDRLGYDPQASLVGPGVRAHQLVGLIKRD